MSDMYYSISHCIKFSEDKFSPNLIMYLYPIWKVFSIWTPLISLKIKKILTHGTACPRRKAVEKII